MGLPVYQFISRMSLNIQWNNYKFINRIGLAVHATQLFIIQILISSCMPKHLIWLWGLVQLLIMRSRATSDYEVSGNFWLWGLGQLLIMRSRATSDHEVSGNFYHDVSGNFYHDVFYHDVLYHDVFYHDVFYHDVSSIMMSLLSWFLIMRSRATSDHKVSGNFYHDVSMHELWRWHPTRKFDNSVALAGGCHV